MSDRFYCQNAARGGRLALEGDEARHLAKVRRVGVGETVVLFDGQGFATRAEVVLVGNRRVELDAVGPPLPDRAADVRLTLATAVPKGDRFDWLVEKATEIGVDRLVPLITERSVVDPRAAKLDRLRRTVLEASKQCGRNRLMAIAEPVALDACNGPPAQRLMAHPEGLPQRDWPTVESGADVWLAVGPEGGFSDGETERAVGAGWTLVGLGPTLLRIETAAVVAAARVLALGEGRGSRTNGGTSG